MNSTPGEYSLNVTNVIAGFRKNHMLLFDLEKMWEKIHSVAVKEQIVVCIVFKTFCISH